MKQIGFIGNSSMAFNKCLAAAIIGMFAPVYASAGLTIESVVSVPGKQAQESSENKTSKSLKKSMVASRTASGSARITSIGLPHGDLKEFSGIGRDVTLKDALQQILPYKWKAYAEGDVDNNDKLNWKGGKSWPAVLNEIFETLDLNAEINWNTNEITVWPNETYESQSTKQGREQEKIAVQEKLALKEKISQQANELVEQAARKAVADTQWELTPGKSLSENLRAWSDRAGWKLVWSARVDYPVDAEAKFIGKINGKDGAIAKVIGGYSDAEFPLEVEFFNENRVIEIRLNRMRLN